MHYYLNLIGESPILHRNAASSLDTSSVTSRAITELARKRARTESEHTQLRELECQRSLWLSDDGRPMIPCAALRACIESAARRSKEGPGVRSGLVVDDTTFHFDVERYGDTLDEWGKRCQYTVPVVVQRNRILRTRARFETPWGLEAHLFAAAGPDRPGAAAGVARVRRASASGWATGGPSAPAVTGASALPRSTRSASASPAPGAARVPSGVAIRVP